VRLYTPADKGGTSTSSVSVDDLDKLDTTVAGRFPTNTVGGASDENGPPVILMRVVSCNRHRTGSTLRTVSLLCAVPLPVERRFGFVC
jgi:hypothetical protein